MKTEQNQDIRGVLIFTLLLTLLIGLCLPTAFETSAQVGVDARSSKKESPNSIPKVSAKLPKKTAAKKPLETSHTRNIAIEGLMNSFVKIPAGEFMMGSEKGNSNEKPVHRVKISRSFEMGKYEVTQAQWEAVMGKNPSAFRGENLPVENVSWEDAQEFIKNLNAGNDDYIYRLPTEAEWEYACRAGTTEEYEGNLEEMAWRFSNSEKRTHPVSQKKPNAWGLYDMHGNVWEWCQDWYAREYYIHSPKLNPRGPNIGSIRMGRGGSYNDDEANLRSAVRYGFTPKNRFNDLGFRLVRTSR